MVTARRERENERFGRLLAGWTAEGFYPEDDAETPARSGATALLRVEEVLRKVLARVAREVPVLFIVVDGMSWAVFRELIESIAEIGWIEWGTKDRHLPCPVVAALPSLTEVSRASLLSGQLVAGTSEREAANFKKHPDLVRASDSQLPPALFHKGGLTDTGAADLSRAVRDAIAAEDQRIVGVVINGVDDHLAKGEQINVPWVLPSLPLLKVLMETAAAANRFVIITSDHGHVIERRTAHRKGELSERYRHDDGRPLADELLITGARVMLPANKRHIASWSERVRYCQPKKHGYHGGITPQECLVPLAILSRPDQSIGNWRELPLYRPLWWEIAPRLSRESKARRARAGCRQSERFEPEIPHPRRPPAVHNGDGSWRQRRVD